MKAIAIMNFKTMSTNGKEAVFERGLIYMVEESEDGSYQIADKDCVCIEKDKCGFDNFFIIIKENILHGSVLDSVKTVLIDLNLRLKKCGVQPGNCPYAVECIPRVCDKFDSDCTPCKKDYWVTVYDEIEKEIREKVK